VVTNQPVVARGLCTEKEVVEVHDHIQTRLEEGAGIKLDAFYFCPHHPEATVKDYRIICPCRKPRAGMLEQAARDLGLDLKRSFMVGDRITDVIAGHAAGCTTVQVETGMHEAVPIVAVDPVDLTLEPDHRCANLETAAEWILERSS
jgi:D-glycero-D-manno-heptose 1,7-bisphosphate phosphatase